MKFETVKEFLIDIPYMGIDEGWELYNFVYKNKPKLILELGHAHGASSIYLAAALDELGTGILETVDLKAAEHRVPNLEELAKESGLAPHIRIYREKNSYTWFLKKKIEQCSVNNNCQPIYDFCFIDGPKNWTIDGFTFFLVNKLLQENGWILFDDYKWTHAKHIGREATDGITVRTLGEDEINQAHIELVFNLLVTQSKEYSNFEIQDNWWAWAQKTTFGSREIKYTKKKFSGI